MPWDYRILSGKPWSSLIEEGEGCIPAQAVSCCLCDKPKINYTARTWKLSIHVLTVGLIRLLISFH